MSLAQIKGQKVDIRLWTRPHEVEAVALDQLRNISALPWVFHHVAAMPDVHFGKGATVGSVVAMQGAVSPAAVGVDIGCGMGAVETNLTASDLPDSLRQVRFDIESVIPTGFGSHGKPVASHAGSELWTEFPSLTKQVQKLVNKTRCP